MGFFLLKKRDGPQYLAIARIRWNPKGTREAKKRGKRRGYSSYDTFLGPDEKIWYF
jgi:hypothetical protein